ncbi:MAG TPA: hypothetical protein VF379_06495 [Gaiellaceae bacterium]
MRRILVLGFAMLAIAAGVARGGSPAAPLPLPCGLPQVQPLWVDYADGMVPFWSTIFARPGIVGAASNFIVPPQLRAKGAQTVYFDLYLNNRVGTPTKPADPSTIQARADKLFDTAVTSSGCDHPLIAENELFGAQLPTPWTPTTAQYRANVLAYLQRLSDRGARPFLLLSNRPYTHDEAADEWWRLASQVADIVPEVYFSGPAVSRQGAAAGSRRLRATMRTRMEDLIQIGVPTNRLGMMLTFSSTPNAGGREGLGLSSWLDVVKWEGLASKQVAAELQIASVWSWGWAAFNPAGNDPDKPKAACVWLWTRDHSLCDAPALAGKDFDPSLDVGATLPAGTLCLLGTTRLDAKEVAALSRLTGDRDLAFSAELQHAVLVEEKAVDAKALAQAVVDTILDHFGGSRAAYLAALTRAKATPALARVVLADELRRREIQATLHVAGPTTAGLQQWYDTYSASPALAVRTAKPEPWLGNLRTGIAIQGQAPGRLFALATGESVKIDGVQVTAVGEVAPLGSFPLAQAAPAVRRAFSQQQRAEAFAVWLRKRENQNLGGLACQHDQNPQPATVDLTDWLPYLALA